MPSAQPYEDEYEQRPGFWTRMKERMFGVDPVEDDHEDGLPPLNSRRTVRLDAIRGIKIAVRMNASAFTDARIAADGLKNGQQQIVNLEQATPQMAERIIDFLNGVTYAMDGCVEKIGDRVYLFAPANVDVEMDAGGERDR